MKTSDKAERRLRTSYEDGTGGRVSCLTVQLSVQVMLQQGFLPGVRGVRLEGKRARFEGELRSSKELSKLEANFEVRGKVRNRASGDETEL